MNIAACTSNIRSTHSSVLFFHSASSQVYIGYATGHTEFVNESQLWAIVACTIFASTMLHGTTSFLVDRFASE